MNINKKSSSLGFVAGLLLSFFTTNAAAALNISQSPLVLADQVASSVMVMLDNSGSMTSRMFSGVTFDPTNGKYAGIFDKEKNYTYDSTIPVHTAAFTSATGYYIPVDPDAKGAFVESACTLPTDAATGCWSGNFLNWMTARRIDASRDVLIGGKLESRTAYPLYGTGLNYKIVANNEPSDRNFTISHSSSSSYSPIPDDAVLSISSPAAGGNYKSIYDPYAKLSAQLNSPIYNSASDVIGEFGTKRLKEQYVTVNLNKSYLNPIVIATAPTHEGGDPSVVRIKNVTTNSFEMRIQEWDYRDGTHANENLSFIVIENGEHELVGGVKIKTGKTNTDAEYVNGNCGSLRTNTKSVTFSSTFASTPIVISSAMTENDPDAINTRVWDIDTNGFTLALQEEESPLTSGHSIETIGYIAITPGTTNDTTNNFMLEAGTLSNVGKATKTLTYSSTFSSTPSFVAAMQTMNEGDSAALRLNSNSSSSATIHVEEEKSCSTPNEDAHADENVGYLALDGKKPSYNLAVAVKEEPTGTLHRVKDDVRLGISFYRYDPEANNIYESSVIHGGTLRFNIPKNPFVKKPNESDVTKLPADQKGYRIIEGYVGRPIETIVDAVEHYPMIWGTTPLAENLWEVIQYFEQDKPYYDTKFPLDTPFADFVKANDSTPDDKARDPYYVPTYGKTLQCVNSNILIVTDGEPYKDAAIPTEPAGYDGDSKSGDVSDLLLPDTQGKDNLDDVAYWAFCDKTADDPSCKTGTKATTTVGSKLRPNLRDLRPLLDGKQFLKIDTIGFAGNSVRPILQDTADNAGGTAYKASDGDELDKALTEAFKNAAQEATVSAISANSTRRNTDTLIYLASFNSGDWSGQLRAFELDADGNALSTPKWHTDSAGAIPAHGSRNIFTYKLPASATAIPTGAGVEFKAYADLSSTQQADLGADETEALANINYLRGDSTGEGTIYRQRTTIDKDPITGTATTHKRLLGDIVNSSPWFAGRFNFGYHTLSGDEGTKYRPFLTANLSRKDAVYVGANDGMLHAFDATLGKELFAYIPATAFPNLKKLTLGGYGTSPSHQNFVDGSPRTGDAYYANAWHTILTSTLGAGGKGIFALDVTDPSSFTKDKVLFEYNGENSAKEAIDSLADTDPNNDTTDDLGYTIGEPTIVRMADDKWYILMGNGYNSVSGKAVLYLFDIAGMKSGTAGSVIKLDTGVSGDNGLGTPIPVDVNGDHTVDAIYAGDLKGNMWKFDVTDNLPSKWGSAFGKTTPVPLFTALDANGNPQAITAKPQVGPHPDGGAMVYFGTGKFFEVGDNVIGLTPQVQTFYGLRDDFPSDNTNDNKPIGTRISDLVEQKITVESSSARVTTENEVDYTSKKGWYMDLKLSTGSAKGERVLSQAFLTGSRVLFSTVVPDEEPCNFGGSGWLMLLDGATGKRLPDATFDLNDDGLFTTDDTITVTEDSVEKDVSASGKKTGGFGTGGITSDGNKLTVQGVEYVDKKPTPKATNLSNPDGLGRQSWRQIR